MIITAPASSANLGPGFDCLALALELPFRLAAGDAPPEGFHAAEETHPAAVAFRAAAGDPSQPLWWHSPVPPGRGLGFSGAARVAGAYLAGCRDGLSHDDARRSALVVATDLEGHADNAAASAYGGFTVAAADRVLRLEVPAELRVLVWSPRRSTSTDASRRGLPRRVDLEDAAFSLGRAALWVAAMATGDLSVLRDACEDRLHQDTRLAQRPDSAAVRGLLLDRPEVLAAWLSGSGPSVAALVAAEGAELVSAALPEGDHAVRLLDVDRRGVGPLASDG